MKQYLSPYSINLYRRCPRRFYYYINEYPSLPPAEPLREPLEFGKAIHEVIKRYYELIPSSLTPTEVRMYVAKAYREVFPPTLSAYIDRAKQQLQNFIKFEEKRLRWHINPKPVAVEKEFIKGKVHGIVDALFRRGDELIVVDWKTGRSYVRPNEDIVVQMNVYLYITGSSRAYVLFLEHGGFVEVTRRFDVEDLVETILEDKVFPPRRSPECMNCEYQIPCLLKQEIPNPLKYSLWSVEI